MLKKGEKMEKIQLSGVVQSVRTPTKGKNSYADIGFIGGGFTLPIIPEIFSKVESLIEKPCIITVGVTPISANNRFGTPSTVFDPVKLIDIKPGS